MPVTNEAPNKYAPTQWGGESLEDLVCPSGQLCQVRRPGPEGLVKAGVITSVDSLTGIVANVLIPSAEGKPKIDPAKLIADEEALAGIMHVTDRIVCHVVVQPTIKMAPNDVTAREQGVIYTDMVDLSDKMFILQFAMGGLRDLESFREQSAALVGSMDDVEGDGGKAQ